MTREELNELNEKYSSPLYRCNPKRIHFPFIKDDNELFFSWDKHINGDYYICNVLTLEEITEKQYAQYLFSQTQAVSRCFINYITDFLEQKYLEYKNTVKQDFSLTKYKSEVSVTLYFKDIIVEADSEQEARDVLKEHVLENYKTLNPSYIENKIIEIKPSI